MRSTSPTPRRLRRRGPAHGFLPALAGLVDHATLDEPGHVLVYVEGPVHPDVALGLKSLDRATHPFEALAGFRAPSAWTAFGIRARGTARLVDAPDAPPQPTAITFLVDRAGAEASVLRVHDVVTEPPGPAVGTIPDLGRRVLGVPTAPPPGSPGLLWTAMWLDRVLEAWGQPHRRRDLTSTWGQIAVLHPAIHAPAPPDLIALADPSSLLSVARSHAAATSWRDLRCSPLPLPLPDGALDHAVARWMDDGFFARWTIGAFPPPEATAAELAALLGEPQGSRLLEVTRSLIE